MAKTPIKKSKTPKKPTAFPTIMSWNSSWVKLDRAIQNFRKYMERSFERHLSFHPSFPAIALFPKFSKMPETSCDVIDEGN